MKKFFLLLCIPFLSLPCMAQEQQGNPSVKTTYRFQRMENGKYSCSLAKAFGESGRWVFPGKAIQTSAQHAEIPAYKQPELLHHIVFHFDNPLIGCDVWITGTDTLFFDLFNMTWTSNSTLEADIPDGYYEFCCYNYQYPSNSVLVLQHNFHVYRNMDTTILSTSANHTITMHALDENGNELNVNPHFGDGLNMSIELPNGLKMPNLWLDFLGILPLTISVNDIPAEYTFLMNRTNVVKNKVYQQYMITYPALQGLTHDTSFTNSPGDYHALTHVLQSSPAGKKYYYCWGSGQILNDSLTGYIDEFIGGFADNYYHGHALDTVILFANQSACDTIRSFFGSVIDKLEDDPGSFTDLYTGYTYLYKNANMVMSAEGNYPPVSADYSIPDGDWAFIGSTAPFNLTWTWNTPGQPLISFYTGFRGQSNERRDCDLNSETYDIYRQDSLLVHDSLYNDPSVQWWTPDLDVYRVAVNDSNYIVCGMPGYSQGFMTFNLANPVDVNPPYLIGFKVLQGDLVSTDVVHGYPASVLFAAGDYTHSNSSPRYYTLREVLLYYKEYHDSTWFPLTVNAIPALLDSMSAMPYIADLQPVLDAFPDSAYIDLNVVLVDSAYNTTSQTFHPAFLLRDVIAGTGHQVAKKGFTIYPNPTSTKVTIENGDRGQLSILNLNGQELITRQITESKTQLDITNLPNGVYFVRVTGERTVEVGKFIKQ